MPYGSDNASPSEITIGEVTAAPHVCDGKHLGLPLILFPSGAPDGAVSANIAENWLAKNRAFFEQRLTQHGALLLRGFAVDSPQTFERVARATGADLKKDYLGTSPRNALTEYVFNASELPPFYPIPQHCEMSFLKNPPRRLLFGCLLPSHGPGGETSLCDFRRVYDDLDPAVRDRFERRGVRTVRNYSGPQSRGRRDLWQLKPWHEMFGTEDRAIVEAKAAECGLEARWLDAAGAAVGDSGRLRLISTQPAVRRHPETGEPVWFNHSQVFHLSSAADEYRRIAARIPDWRYHFLSLFAKVSVAAKRLGHVFDGVSEREEIHAMHATFGDGSPISDSDMDRVRDAIWKNLVLFRWRLGDVLFIDNFSVSHGRLPYRGPRHIVVSWD